MRTIVDIPDPTLAWLATHCEKEDISRAEAVRRAVEIYKAQQEQQAAADKEVEFQKILRETAGAWKNDPYWRNKDSVEYIREIRDEWEDPWEQP